MNPNNPDASGKETRLPRFECTKCGACCCDDKLLVTVTGTDIVRIATTLGLDENDLLKALDFYILSDGLAIPDGLEEIPSVATEKGPAYIALKKMKTGECIFLKENLCMIHPIRPQVCRSFPFFFNQSNNQINWGLSARKGICPGLGIGPRVSKDEVNEIASNILSEMKTYKEFSDEWNNSQKSPRVSELLKAIFSDRRFFT